MPILEVDDYGEGPTFDVDLPEPAPPPPVAPEPPVLSAAGRVVRPRITPARYRDMLPSLPSPGTQADTISSEPTTSGETKEEIALLLYRSERNKFGLLNVYRRVELPCSVENGTATLASTHYPELLSATWGSNLFAPFPNYSSFVFGRWHWSKSAFASLDRTIQLQEALNTPGVKLEDLVEMDMHKVLKQLKESSCDDSPLDGWKRSTLKIPVPLGSLNLEAPKSVEFGIDQFHHRSLVEVIRSVFGSPEQSAGFCYEPYEVRYKPPHGGEDMAVYGEMYWSKAFRDAHDEVQRLPREPGDDLPRAVVAMQFWSDGLAATKFGTAKLWPAYLQFGNQSKYERSKHGSRACHQVAFIPFVSINLV